MRRLRFLVGLFMIVALIAFLLVPLFTTSAVAAPDLVADQCNPALALPTNDGNCLGDLKSFTIIATTASGENLFSTGYIARSSFAGTQNTLNDSLASPATPYYQLDGIRPMTQGGVFAEQYENLTASSGNVTSAVSNIALPSTLFISSSCCLGFVPLHFDIAYIAFHGTNPALHNAAYGFDGCNNKCVAVSPLCGGSLSHELVLASSGSFVPPDGIYSGGAGRCQIGADICSMFTYFEYGVSHIA